MVNTCNTYSIVNSIITVLNYMNIAPTSITRQICDAMHIMQFIIRYDIPPADSLDSFELVAKVKNAHCKL